MIYGNIEGVKKSILNNLDELYDLKIERDTLFNLEIVDTLINTTKDINREVSVAIDRKGNIINVSIGDSSTVNLPEVDFRKDKLAGIRVIHTHPNGVSYLSDMDISAMLTLKLDCMVAIGVDVNDDRKNRVNIGMCSLENDKIKDREFGPLTIEEAFSFNFLDKVKYVEDNLKFEHEEEEFQEKAILVGVDSYENLDELEELAKACNVITLDRVFQRREVVDSAFFVGKGKVSEIQMLRQTLDANVVIFDDELSASQVRNLEDIIGVKVIDRTTLILEIFARRAKSSEAKLQVELAQLRYRLPRLIGLGTVLSRTGAGIGTRGPGEKKLEVDKRHIRNRISDIKKELEKHKKNRMVQRERRDKRNISRVSLVGYTNAGKSTLRNKLCEIGIVNDGIKKEKVFEADMLFATLDTTTRGVLLPDNRVITLSDTVGFVRKLPHQLVEAFKSTLEEVIFSDLLLHVVDISSDDFEEQFDAVNDVLTQLGVDEKKLFIIFNKIDKITEEELNNKIDIINTDKYICISAKQELNLDSLLNKIGDLLPEKLFEKTFLIPYSMQNYTALIHRNGKVTEEEYKDNGTYITALVDDETYNRCKNFEFEL